MADLQVLSKLVVSYVASHANSAVVLHRLWGLSPNLVLAGMIALYSTEGTTITRCLDICQVRYVHLHPACSCIACPGASMTGLLCAMLPPWLMCTLPGLHASLRAL